MKRKFTLKAALTLTTLITAVVLTACQDSDNSNTPMGSVTIAVTDSPIDDASAVWIQFVGLTFYSVDGYKTQVTFDEPKLINLLSLQGSLSEEVLTEHALPAGDYSYATFNIDFNASSIVINETAYSLQPNFGDWDTFFKQFVLESSVEPPIVPFTIEESLTTHMTFDFDLRKSIFDDGNSNIYSFSPAIRSVITNESANIAGSIDGATNFDKDCAADDSAIYAYSGKNQSLKDIRGTSSDPFSTSNITNTGSGYTYELGFLPAGDYTVAIACNVSDDTANQIEDIQFGAKKNITVSQGESLIADF
jgi:hypothetical protein